MQGSGQGGPEPLCDGAFSEGDEVEIVSDGGCTEIRVFAGQVARLCRRYSGNAPCHKRRGPCHYIALPESYTCIPEAGLKKITPEFKVGDAVVGFCGCVGYVDEISRGYVRGPIVKSASGHASRRFNRQPANLKHYLLPGDKVRLLGYEGSRPLYRPGIGRVVTLRTLRTLPGRLVTPEGYVYSPEIGYWSLAHVEKVEEGSQTLPTEGATLHEVSTYTPKAKSAWGPVSLRVGDVVEYTNRRLVVRYQRNQYVVELGEDDKFATTAAITQCTLLERKVPEVTGKPMETVYGKRELWINGVFRLFTAGRTYRWSDGRFRRGTPGGSWIASSAQPQPDDDVEIRVRGDT